MKIWKIARKFKEFWNHWHVCDFYVLTELHDISVIGSEQQIFKKYWEKLTFLETEFYFWPQWTNLIFRWRKDRKIKKGHPLWCKNEYISDWISFSECQIFLSLKASYKNNVYQEIFIIIEHVGKIVTMSGFIINNDRIS